EETGMSLEQLSPEWRQWVRENVARGCTAASMLPMMVQGGLPRALSERVLAAVHGAGALPVGTAGEAAEASARASALASALAEHTRAVPDMAAGGQVLRGRPRPRLAGNRLRLADGCEPRIVLQLDHPQILLYEGLLSPDECAEMIALAESRLTRSTVVDEQLGEARPHEHRSSAGGFFQRGEQALVTRIEARLAELLDWPVENGEGLQVLRYGAGGEYRAHFDWFNPTHPGSERHLRTGGQRVGTCVIYLSEVEDGGGTRFPNLGLEVRPQPGAALYFADVDPRGVEDPGTLHAGMPVLAGVKYIATKWLRERRYG
ncbi:MAG TPA: 2OG-Fe(II) oxygenase, partial [Burkholderiaceae bacterium]|nr:2OG-Fe(II) oxygenase [Burkholderiaceae bacterium]